MRVPLTSPRVGSIAATSHLDINRITFRITSRAFLTVPRDFQAILHGSSMSDGQLFSVDLAALGFSGTPANVLCGLLFNTAFHPWQTGETKSTHGYSVGDCLSLRNLPIPLNAETSSTTTYDEPLGGKVGRKHYVTTKTTYSQTFVVLSGKDFLTLTFSSSGVTLTIDDAAAMGHLPTFHTETVASTPAFTSQLILPDPEDMAQTAIHSTAFNNTSPSNVSVLFRWDSPGTLRNETIPL